MVVDSSLTRWLRAASLMAVLLAGAAPAPATTVAEKRFADLCAEADMIFSATVAEVRSQRVSEDRGDLETLVTFTVSESIYGVSDSSITLRFAGGTLDGVREEFLGVPRFTPGERVVLFARKGYELSPVVGLSQGCFRVVASASGPTVTTSEGRVVTVADLGAPAADGGQAAGAGPLAVDRFLDAVRDELDAQGRHP